MQHNRAAALFFRRRSTIDSCLRRRKLPPKFAEIAAENSRDFNPNRTGSNEGQGHMLLKAWIFTFFNKKWNYELDWTINIVKSDLFETEILIQQTHDKEMASKYLFI